MVVNAPVAKWNGRTELGNTFVPHLSSHFYFGVVTKLLMFQGLGEAGAAVLSQGQA